MTGVLAVGLLGAQAASAAPATAVNLGTADEFAVLAGAGITNTGTTGITGDVGTHPTGTISGTPLTITGTNHGDDEVTRVAKEDLLAASTAAAGQGPATPITGNLGGQTLAPGVHGSAATVALTGTLTLDAADNADAIFVVQAGTSLTTAANSNVVLANGAQACNVFWRIGSSADLGAGAAFVGSILADTSISAAAGATIEGRALAINGAVTLDTNTITLPVCASTVTVASSASATLFGVTTTLTATVGPGSPSGPVSFSSISASTGAAATTNLGTATLSGGVATLTVAMPAFGPNFVGASYDGDTTHHPASAELVAVEVSGYAGQLIVTELRTTTDTTDTAYLELYNTGPPVPLGGLRIRASSGRNNTLVPNTPTLGTRRSYLLALSGAAVAPDRLVTGIGYGGIDVRVPDSALTRTDAVGPDSGHHLGTGIPAMTGTPAGRYAWVRLQVAGVPRNTSDNASDFWLVSNTGGSFGGVQSTLGGAVPSRLSSPVQNNAALRSTLLDPTVSAAAEPNRGYVAGSPGTLVIRRTITNVSTETATALSVRLTALSQANGAPKPGVVSQPVSHAHLRAVNPAEETSVVTTAGRGPVTVDNLGVADVGTLAAGGGLNNTLTSTGTDGDLAPGDSVDVAFTFSVDTGGTFWFGYHVEATMVASAQTFGQRAVAPTGPARVPRRSPSTMDRAADGGRLALPGPRRG
jgi:hypothetical protein